MAGEMAFEVAVEMAGETAFEMAVEMAGGEQYARKCSVRLVIGLTDLVVGLTVRLVLRACYVFVKRVKHDVTLMQLTPDCWRSVLETSR